MSFKKYLCFVFSALVWCSVQAEVTDDNRDKDMGVIVGEPIVNNYDKLEKATAYKKTDNSITISKVRLEIPKGKKSDFVTVYNKSSSEEFGFTVQIVHWNQNSGKDKLVESGNVLVAPKTFVIKPQEYKNIRIFAKDYEQALKDYSYRLVLTQISRKSINKEQDEINKLKVHMIMTLPIFFNSEVFKEADQLNINLDLDKDRKYLTIENKDKQYIVVKNFVINEKEYPHNWYILPGITLRKKISDLPIAKTYKIEVQTDRESIKREINN